MQIAYIHDVDVGKRTASCIQVFHMCFALAKLGHKVILVIPGNRYTDENIKKYISDVMNRPVIFDIYTYKKISIANRFSVWGAYWAISEILENISVDFCIVRSPVVMHIALKKGINTIFESHSARLHNTNVFFDFLLKKRILALSKSPRLISFVTISERLRNYWFASGVPESRIKVLHDAVDAEDYADILTRNQARNMIGIEKDEKVVLYAGSLYENRAVERMMQIAMRLKDVTFVIVGGPRERKEKIEKMCKEQNVDNVKLTGIIPHYYVKNYLCAADILLMLFTKKVKTMDYCSPLKMFEYMASGRTIIADDFPVLREVLTHNKNAILVRAGSIEELQTAIIKELYNPNFKIGCAARKEVMTLYTWEKRAASIIKDVENVTAT